MVLILPVSSSSLPLRPERDLDWNDAAVEGCSRFLNRVWRTFTIVDEMDKGDLALPAELNNEDKELRRIVHTAVKRVSDDIALRSQFNTAISAIMEAINALNDYLESGNAKVALANEAAELINLLLAPFAPHIAEELWHIRGHKDSVHLANWPEYDESALVLDTVEIVVQVNGKIKARLDVAAELDKAALEQAIREHADLDKWTAGKQIVKLIAIPGKLANIVVK